MIKPSLKMASAWPIADAALSQEILDLVQRKYRVQDPVCDVANPSVEAAHV